MATKKKTEKADEKVKEERVEPVAEAVEEQALGALVDRFWAAERTGDPAQIREAVRRILAVDPHWGANVPAVAMYA